MEKRFDGVLARIERARLDADEHNIVKIVAVSKYVEADAIEELYKVGHRAFGENKVQDLLQKQGVLDKHPIEWHFVGRLQKNKINHLIDARPSLVHSIDSLELALEIDKRLAVKGKKLSGLLQINSSAEATKAGVTPEDAVQIYHDIQTQCSNITLKGVMSIGAHSEDEALIEKSFQTTYNIYDSLKKDGAKYCSMGMSGDFELAVKNGSNMLRLGSVLFNS